MLLDTGNIFANPYTRTQRRSAATKRYLYNVYRNWGYQAVALGRGDLENITGKKGGSHLPWVCANMAAQNVKPYRVIKVGTWKVAVTSLMGKSNFAAPKGWIQPSLALKKVLKKLPKVDATILLLPSPARGMLPYLDDIDLALGGVSGRGKDKRQGSPYLLWLRMPRGGQMGMVTMEKGRKGVQLVSFRLYTLDSKVPADPKVTKEIRALTR